MDFESFMKASRFDELAWAMAKPSMKLARKMGAVVHESHQTLMVRPNAHVWNMKAKIETLTDQLENVVLLAKK